MGRGGSMPESIISISIPNPRLPQPRCTTTQCLMYITVCRCRWPRPRRTTQRPRFLKRPNGCSWLRRRPWVSMVISRCHCVQAGPTGLRWYSPENGGSPTSKNGWSLASKPHTNQRGTTETGEFTWGTGPERAPSTGPVQRLPGCCRSRRTWSVGSALGGSPRSVPTDRRGRLSNDGVRPGRVDWQFVVPRPGAAVRRPQASTPRSVSSASNLVSGTSLASMAQWSMPGPMVWSCGCR